MDCPAGMVMKRLLTLTFRVNEQDMFYSYPVQPVYQFIQTINYVDISCLFVIVCLSLDFLMLRTPIFINQLVRR